MWTGEGLDIARAWSHLCDAACSLRTDDLGRSLDECEARLGETLPSALLALP